MKKQVVSKKVSTPIVCVEDICEESPKTPFIYACQATDDKDSRSVMVYEKGSCLSHTGWIFYHASKPNYTGGWSGWYDTQQKCIESVLEYNAQVYQFDNWCEAMRWCLGIED